MKIQIASSVALLLTQGLWAADPKELSLRWTELEPAIAGRQVRIVTPSGVRIQGRALVVQPQALLIKIEKTSNKKVHPKGEASLPRSAISVLQVMKYGVRWRIIGTAIAPALVAVAGTAAVIRSGNADDLPRYVGFGAAGVIGAGVGGYYLGRRADRHVTTIRIVQ
jgi:hypothetical protein